MVMEWPGELLAGVGDVEAIEGTGESFEDPEVVVLLGGRDEERAGTGAMNEWESRLVEGDYYRQLENGGTSKAWIDVL